MYYKSDVGLVITGIALLKMLEPISLNTNSAHVRACLDNADCHVKKNGNHLFLWDNTNWYDDTEESLILFMEQLAELDNSEYLFIEIGEKHLKHEGDYWHNDFQFGFICELTCSF